MQNQKIRLNIGRLAYLIVILLIFKTSRNDETVFIIGLNDVGPQKPVFRLGRIDIALWKERFGDLTIIGMRNQFNLGRLIQNKFPSLFVDEPNPNMIKIYTSSSYASISSAISQAKGLTFGLNNFSKIETPGNASAWTPPNSTVNGSDLDSNLALGKGIQNYTLQIQEYGQDYLFGANYSCPGFEETIEKTAFNHNEQYTDYFKESYKVFEKENYNPMNYFQDKHWNYTNAVELSNMLIDQFYSGNLHGSNHQSILHSRFISSFNESIKYLDNDLNKSMYSKMIESWVKWLHKYRTLPIIDRVNFPKMIMYSGEFENMFSIVQLLVKKSSVECLKNVYEEIILKTEIDSEDETKSRQQLKDAFKKMENSECPNLIPFSSNLIFEVFEKKKLKRGFDWIPTTANPHLYVRFWLQNKPIKIFRKLEYPLEEFMIHLKLLIDESFSEKCDSALKSTHSEFTLIFLFFILLIFAIVLFLSVIIYALYLQIKIKKERPEEVDCEENFNLNLD